MSADFNYAEEFKKLDVEALRRDMTELMTKSQDWWPADYGNYGPFFIRMTWHAAGTYRTADGRGGGGGGMQRFAPLDSWPDNANLDRARRLLWPIKQKYGNKVSWADLIVYAGHLATEAMGLKTFGFGFGRPDRWEPDEIFWGPESSFFSGGGTGDERHADAGDINGPMGADHMGLIYVNPEGPSGNPDPALSAKYIRNTFKRMAMNDEETVALIVGGHTFGKAHGAAPPQIGPEPEGAPLENQLLGWHNAHGTGKGADTVTSGLEGPWTTEPTKWDNGFLENLYKYDYELSKSPAGAQQWAPKPDASGTVPTAPDANDSSKRQTTMMLTTDMALKADPSYAAITKRFFENPDQLSDAFAKAWYKLLHRDMGPVVRLLGPWVPAAQIWQDPVTPGAQLSDADVADLKAKVLASGLSISQLVSAAWASAATFRSTDKRGGANGARVRLEPQKSWEANNPAELSTVISTLEKVKQESGKNVSIADLIVIGGAAAIEEAARKAGTNVTVPVTTGRGDATQEQTDVESFEPLEPTFDGFRNYFRASESMSPEEALVERAFMLNLTSPEMTVLVGGMRALKAAQGQSGILTDRPETLTNDFFVNLLDVGTEWQAAGPFTYQGRDRASRQAKWTATSVDLVFGANSQLRAVAEVYAQDDSKDKFVQDFVKAWTKVMDLDRYDV